MSIIPTFRIRTSEYNTSNLKDLAGSLSQAFSNICASGAVINQFNIGQSTINQLRLTANAGTGYILTSYDASGDAHWQSQSTLSQIQTFTGVGFTSSI